jgi:hypothetical protein
VGEEHLCAFKGIYTNLTERSPSVLVTQISVALFFTCKLDKYTTDRPGLSLQGEQNVPTKGMTWGWGKGLRIRMQTAPSQSIANN